MPKQAMTGAARQLLQLAKRSLKLMGGTAVAILFGGARYTARTKPNGVGTPPVRTHGGLLAQENMAPLQACDRVHVEDVMDESHQRIGVIWLYLFASEGRAKRLFKLMDPRWSERLPQLKQHRHFMADMAYDPRTGVESLLQGTRSEVQQLLQAAMRALPSVNAEDAANAAELRSRMGDGFRGDKPGKQSDRRDAAPLRLTYNRPPEAPHQPAVPLAPRRVEGEAFEGTISAARRVRRQGLEGPYQSFCLTIHDGQRETPLYGAELERSTLDLGLHPGERVRVVYMGKQALDIPGAEHRKFKNLYQVTRVAQ